MPQFYHSHAERGRIAMNGLRQLIRDEPVIVVGLVQAAIAMGVTFGLGWTAEQVAGVITFTQVLLSVVARSLVTPVANVDAKVQRAVGEERMQQAALTAEEMLTLAELRAERDRLEVVMNQRES